LVHLTQPGPEKTLYLQSPEELLADNYLC